MEAANPKEHRVVRQSPRGEGHLLQPGWVNPGAFVPRIEAVEPYVRGRSVLDVGCTSALGRDDWVHAGIARAASRAVGVDIDPEGVERARALGYDVRVVDGETLDLGETFEVVHAGELIEHLDNPRAFLQACRGALAPGGRLLLTTPNAFAISNFVYRLGGTPRVNGDHTCWYCEDTLRQLLERNHYEVEECRYLAHETPGTWRRRLVRPLRQLLPDRLAWNTLFVIARPVGATDG